MNIVVALLGQLWDYILSDCTLLNATIFRQACQIHLHVLTANVSPLLTLEFRLSQTLEYHYIFSFHIKTENNGQREETIPHT